MPANERDVARAEIAKQEAGKASIADQILSRSQSARPEIEPFTPLAKSLEWDLGQRYLRGRASAAFINDTSPVPFIVNNDSLLSRRAAELFFASMEESRAPDDGGAKAGEPIYVLELGVGVGLFARFWLDHFRDLSREHGRDYYDRLCYILADKSPRMLLDVARHGILAGHAGHYRLRVVDARAPEVGLPYDVCFAAGTGESVESGARSVESGALHPPRSALHSPPKRFHAVFLNYLLDCLPAAVLDVRQPEQGEEEVRLLHVRTCLARNVNLADHTDMTIEQVRERAKSKEPRAREELLSIYGLFASEYEYLPLEQAEMKNEERRMKNEKRDEESIPYLDFALDFARKKTNRLVHSYGAIQCLEKLSGLVEEDGFILINDYGQAEIKADDDFEHQRFSLATFVGVNFPLLNGYFGGESGAQSAESGARAVESGAQSAESRAQDEERSALCAPLSTLHPSIHEPFGGDSGGIHSRLLSRAAGRETLLRFQAVFGRAEYERVNEPLNKAREAVKVGRFEAAMGFYRQALERQPRNWVVLSEIAQFLTFSVRDPKAGADLAKLALRLNPACSSDLWCTLGDALFEWGRTAEARSAYLRTLKINPGDVRARFNLAFVYTRDKKYEAALVRIGEALGLDKRGEYRERLLQKQAEVLQLAAVKNQQEYLRAVNLVSKG